MFVPRWTWSLAGVLLLLPTVVFAQPGKTRTNSLEEQTFLQDRIEKRLLNMKDNGRKDPRNPHPYWQSLEKLGELPKGYTTLLKLHELYKSRAAKSPEEKIEGTTWASWQLRCLHEISSACLASPCPGGSSC